MLWTALALVFTSGFVHAVWNLFAKRSQDTYVFLWWTQVLAALLFLPWAIASLPGVNYSPLALGLLLASVFLHIAYVLLLAAVYAVGDLSQVYPIMRGTSPLLVPVIGVWLLDERLTAIGWVGVLLIVIGILLLSELRFGRGRQGANRKAPLLAFAVGLCIASYIVVDKLALEHMPAVVLNEASNIGNMLALSWAVRNGAARREWAVNRKTILLGAVLAPSGYLLFLSALALAPVAQLAPMREIGTVFGAVLGVYILKEAHGRRRMLCSLAITAGVVLLGVWGGV